ncbi:MAG TPA: EAL domain-containing protein, partial [Solirubrobacteraceae bacterium]|nr:EAL domain-containing protein [Solirubrobacteraceae bacterium]
AADFMNATACLLNSGDGARLADAPTTGGLRAATHQTLTGDFVAQVLNPEGAEAIASRRQIERVLRERDFSLAFQPIFALDGGAPLGAEALVRFDNELEGGPATWLARAHEVGLGVELELAIVEVAVAQIEHLPNDAVLTVNAGPDVLASGRLPAALGEAALARVVVELTEHLRVEDYPYLASALGELRGAGVRLAIDDAGAGFASLTHILRLAPDFIKLDRQLTRGLDTDPGRRCLANSLARFAEETGAAMIAEGIETSAELAALQKLGIAHGQGFHLARPGPIEELRSAFVAGARRVRHEPPTHGAATRHKGGAPRARAAAARR